MLASILRMCRSGLILILLCLQLSYAKQTPVCDRSACGNIRNISFPFRLRDDPRHCGDARYELVCENNTTFLYPNSHHKYQVKSIDYRNYTIRLSDPSISTNNTCSFSQYSHSDFESLIKHQYSEQSFGSYFVRSHDSYDTLLARPATLLSCPHPVNQSSYVIADICVDRDSIGWHKYVKLGHLNASELGDKCRIDLVFMTSIPLEEYNNTSLLQIHRFLLHGFEVSWFNKACGHKCEGVHCIWDPYHNAPRCGFSESAFEIGLGWLAGIIYVHTFGSTAIKIVIGWPTFLVLLIYKFRRRHLSMFEAIEAFLQNHNHLSPIRYSYSNIKKMTTGFRQKLGQGGFGSVYKGKLRSGHDVAVKVLCTRSKSDGQDFMNEVATIGRIHHVNVVRLVGYCAERSKRALIYDFMPNGSLDKYLRQETAEMLNWAKKFDIAVGVAHGIEYLHRGCDIQILHFDIKPHNILLDENFTPKISDFGLARSYPTEINTVNLTAARGTIGYVAPELMNRSIGNVSYKADVYSFGMLLMEMVGLKRDLEAKGDESSQYFPYWIYNHLDEWKDIEAGIRDADDKMTQKMAIVALWCIQMSPCDRPSMSKVLEMLESEVGSLQIPPRPSYSEPQFVSQNWETDTTDSVALLCEDMPENQFLRTS